MTKLSNYKLWGWVIFIGAGILFPVLVTSPFWLYMLTIFVIYAILVASLDIQYGYTGLTSMAHGAFFGIGAYATGILQVKAGMSFWPSFGLGIVITGILAMVIGFPLLRTKGPYFALGSLALAAVVGMVIFNWEALTGGYSLTGIAKPNPLNIFGWVINFKSKVTFYYLVLLFLLFTLFILRRVVNSRVGRAFIALRQDEDLAEAVGINRIGYEVLAFTLSSVFAGVAGGLYASYQGAIEPAIAGYSMGFNLLAMLIIGGSRSLIGYLIGPFLMWVLPEFLEAAESYRPLLFGFILIVVMIFMPNGMVGGVKRVIASLRKVAGRGRKYAASR